jgi:hypothetical protein
MVNILPVLSRFPNANMGASGFIGSQLSRKSASSCSVRRGDKSAAHKH